MTRKPYIRIMPPDVRGGGPVRFMTAAEGYVMVRRKGCMPIIITTKDWNGWPEQDPAPEREGAGVGR